MEGFARCGREFHEGSVGEAGVEMALRAVGEEGGAVRSVAAPASGEAAGVEAEEAAVA